jgi:hypothetical protein
MEKRPEILGAVEIQRSPVIWHPVAPFGAGRKPFLRLTYRAALGVMVSRVG